MRCRNEAERLSVRSLLGPRASRVALLFVVVSPSK
jgi:hypothetical protein